MNTFLPGHPKRTGHRAESITQTAGPSPSATLASYSAKIVISFL